jgi:hypothetical protein
MINFILFVFHFIFVVYIFIKKYKIGGAKEGFLNIALIGLLFAVGWTLASIVYKTIDENILHIHTIVYNSVRDGTPLKDWFDNSTLPILGTTIVEILFYKSYYKDLWKKNEQVPSDTQTEEKS